jgi:hypothetical protein
VFPWKNIRSAGSRGITSTAIFRIAAKNFVFLCLLFVRRAVPAVPESFGDFDGGKKLTEMVGVQRVHGHALLPFPVFAFGRENAGDAHLFGHRLDGAQL